MSKLMTTDEVAEMLQVSSGTVRNWVSANKIPFVKVNAAVRFERSQLEAWIQKRSVKAFKA